MSPLSFLTLMIFFSCASLTLRHGDGQLKIMYIGGPNQRKDYHVDEGEEVNRFMSSS